MLWGMSREIFEDAGRVWLERFHTAQNAPTGRLAGLSVQQKHVDAQKMLYFTVFLALEGS